MNTIFNTDGFVLRTKRKEQDAAHVYFEFQLYDRDELIFDGDHFSVPVQNCRDNFPWNTMPEDGILALLGCLSVIPGQVAEDWFDDYSPRQMKWCQSGRAQRLAEIVAKAFQVPTT